MGVISRKEQRKENKKQRDWQSKENQLSRDHNLMLAELQNKWNKEQWDRENAYNSPSQQMQRFKDAGLNPNLIYGQSNTSAQLSGSLTAGQGYSPQDFSSSFDHGIADRAVSQGDNMIKSAGQLGQSLMQMPMYAAQVDNVKAQTENIRAQTSKTSQETDLLKSDNKFRDAINQGTVNLQNAQLNGINSNIAKNDAEIGKMRQETVNLQSANNNLIAEYDKIRSTVANLDADTAYKRIRAVLDSQETEANLRKLAASTRLDMANTKSIVSKLTYELAGLKEQAANIHVSTENLKKLGIGYDIENNTMQFNYDQAVSYDDWMKTTGIYRDICLGLTSIAAVIGTALGAGSPTKIKGFR